MTDEEIDQELQVLEAIYGTDFHLINTDSPKSRKLQLSFETPLGLMHLRIEINDIQRYPSEKPQYHLFTDWRLMTVGEGATLDVPLELRGKIDHLFEKTYQDALASQLEGFLHVWAEETRNLLLDYDFDQDLIKMNQTHQAHFKDKSSHTTNSLKTRKSDTEEDALKNENTGNQSTELENIHIAGLSSIVIHTSTKPVTDRKSVFVGHCIKVSSIDEVQRAMSQLLLDKKIAKATHNISAYRIEVTSTGFTQDNCDDDGETAAGSRLLHLLRLLNVRNVLVVVTRWYGGIHLGPARFKHINNAARNVLEEFNFI